MSHDYRLAFHKDVRRMFKEMPDGNRVEAVVRILHETMCGAQSFQARLAKAWGTRPQVLTLRQGIMDCQGINGFVWDYIFVEFNDGAHFTLFAVQTEMCLQVNHDNKFSVDFWPLSGPDGKDDQTA
jgi:hypothetical protein